MWKRKVSLGESGSFVRGKSEFPLRKVQGAKMGRKTRISGRNGGYEIALHIDLLSHRNHGKHRIVLPCKRLSHRKHRKILPCKMGVTQMTQMNTDS